MITVVLLLGLCTYITIIPGLWFRQIFELKIIPYQFRWIILLMALINWFICWIFEHYIIQFIYFVLRRRKRRRRAFSQHHNMKKLYKHIQEQMGKI